MRGPVCLPRFSPFPRQTLPEPDWLHGRSYLAATAKSQEALGKREEARGWAPEGPCPLSPFSPSPWQARSASGMSLGRLDWKLCKLEVGSAGKMGGGKREGPWGAPRPLVLLPLSRVRATHVSLGAHGGSRFMCCEFGLF